MRIKRVKSAYPVERDAGVLKEILDRAVWQENYELAAIIKDVLDEIESIPSPASQSLKDKTG